MYYECVHICATGMCVEVRNLLAGIRSPVLSCWLRKIKLKLPCLAATTVAELFSLAPKIFICLMLDQDSLGNRLFKNIIFAIVVTYTFNFLNQEEEAGR